MRKPIIIALALSGVLLVYGAAGFLWLPHLVRALMENHAEDTGHRVSVAEITFNPFTFTLEVGGYALVDNADSRLVAFKLLRINAGLASIWRWGVVLDEFTLEEPDVRLVVEPNGSINLAKLLPRSKTPEPELSEPPSVHVGRLAVLNGRLTLVDRSRPIPFEKQFSPVQFSLDDFSTRRDHENNYQFSGKSKADEVLEWAGRFTVQPLGSSGRFSIRNLQVLTVQDYLQGQLPARLLSGTADISGQYQMGLDPTISLALEMPSIQVSDIALAGPAGEDKRAPVSVASIALSAVDISLDKKAVVVGGVKISGLSLIARRELDGSLNLSRLSPDQTPTEVNEQVAPAVATNKSWQLSIGAVELEDSRALFEDHSVRPVARIEAEAIHATVKDMTTNPGQSIPVTVELTVNRKARLEASGDFQLNPVMARLAIDLDGFELTALQPYLAETTALELLSGELGAKGELEYTTREGQAPQLKYGGGMNLGKLQTRESATGRDFIKWRALVVSGIDYRHVPSRLLIDRVALREPYARLAIAPDRTLSMMQVLRPNVSEHVERGGQGAAPMSVRIKTVSVEGGTMDFADQSIDPQFAATILGLKGAVAGLSSDPSSRATIQLEGSVGEYAPVLIEGKANLLSITQYSDIAMSFRNMELTTFNPYSGRYAGYNITKGKLTTELRYKLNKRQLEAEHHVVLDNLQFGEATGSKEKVPLPVKLAVALLKDARGVIDIHLPVRGSLDDPSFRFGSVVWQALMGLLSKVVTAPFALLGSIIGAAGEELAYVDFDPGSAELSETVKEKLDKLATALVKRPQLKLDVPLTLAKAEDSKAIARASLNQLVPAPSEEGGFSVDRLRDLESAYVRATNQHLIYPDALDTVDADEVRLKIEYLDQSLLDYLSPDAAALEQLAKSRAQAVQAAILKNTEIAPERIYITSRRATEALESGAVRLELRLE